MSDRTEALLTELVDLQRRTIANQERAIAQQTEAVARQAESIAIQADAVARQKKALRTVWLILALIIVIGLLIPTLTMLATRGR
jgi:hypothetical protein